jgi:hypothetical protein
MAKLIMPRGTKRPTKRRIRSVRKTAQISNLMMEIVEKRAAAEALPVATYVRRAVAEFVALATKGPLPEVNLDGLEDRHRGNRGPVAQWARSVSYVLDPQLSEEVSLLAERRGESISDVVRRAIGLALVREVKPVRPMARLPEGWVTESAVVTGESSEQTVIDVLKEIGVKI